MCETVKIRQMEGGRNILAMNPSQAASLHFEFGKTAEVAFGNLSRSARLRINKNVPPDEVWMSGRLLSGLRIPDYPVYELRAEASRLTVGPCIGLLLCSKSSRFTDEWLGRLGVYLSDYDLLHGAVLAFALDQIDTEKKLIRGYCYRPSDQSWVKGVYPYPCAIYRRIGLSDRWKRHLTDAIGPRIFNSVFFGKWKMYEWFSDNPEIRPYLPFTSLLVKDAEAFRVIRRYKDVYIKPVAGLQGRGIIRIISLDKGGFVFRYRDGEKNFEKKLRTQRSAMKFLNKRTSSGNYLVQQSVKLLQYRGGPVDFRCVMQKNQTGMWKCRTIIGRCGRPGSVVSNISSGGSALRGEEAIRRIRPEWDSGAVISRMEKLALSVCNALDGLGLNFGTLGLDIGVDDEGILWLIEINNRDPDTTIALNIKDKKLFYRLKEGPLFYAKALAGFSSTDEEES